MGNENKHECNCGGKCENCGCHNDSEQKQPSEEKIICPCCGERYSEHGKELCKKCSEPYQNDTTEADYQKVYGKVNTVHYMRGIETSTEQVTELQEKLNDLNSITEDQVSYLKVLSEKETEIINLQEKLSKLIVLINELNETHPHNNLAVLNKWGEVFNHISTIKGETDEV